MEQFVIRRAVPDDTALILSFIRKLAEYEKMEDVVVADEATLRRELFDLGGAETLIGEKAGRPVAFALFFHNFSTFMGRRGIYLEDLFVLPEERGNGYGKAMLAEIARIATERQCGRFEWSCLDWNKPSIGFYLSLGAEPMSEWTTYRLDGERLDRLAEV